MIRELKLIINVGNRSIETLERFEQKFVSLINSRINSGKGCEKFLLKTYDLLIQLLSKWSLRNYF